MAKAAFCSFQVIPEGVTMTTVLPLKEQLDAKLLRPQSFFDLINDEPRSGQQAVVVVNQVTAEAHRLPERKQAERYIWYNYRYALENVYLKAQAPLPPAPRKYLRT